MSVPTIRLSAACRVELVGTRSNVRYKTGLSKKLVPLLPMSRPYASMGAPPTSLPDEMKDALISSKSLVIKLGIAKFLQNTFFAVLYAPVYFKPMPDDICAGTWFAIGLQVCRRRTQSTSASLTAESSNYRVACDTRRSSAAARYSASPSSATFWPPTARPSGHSSSSSCW